MPGRLPSSFWERDKTRCQKKKKEKNMQKKIVSLMIAVSLTVLTACQGGNSAPAQTAAESVSAQTAEETTVPSAAESAPDDSVPDDSVDGQLIFDHSMELQYAKCFSVDYYKGGYKLATISDGTKILVIPEGMSVPADAPQDAILLQQPISNLMVSSTPVTSLINAIGALDAISLTTYDVDSWYIDEVKDALTNGTLTYVGDYKEPDFEKITASGTTCAIYSTMLTEDVAAQLKQLGVSIILDQSSEEEHPLARVEWAKLYGALFNREEEAEKVFQTQVAYLDEIAKADRSDKSVAIFYITSKGALYARNADDYMAKMVDLAGGKYALSDVGVGESGTIKMEFEAFYDKARDADYIIYIWSLGGKPESMEEFLERADILSEMKAVKEGNVWCTTPDYFQISDTIGSMVNDIHLMLEADESTDSLTYLKRLK